MILHPRQTFPITPSNWEGLMDNTVYNSGYFPLFPTDTAAGSGRYGYLSTTVAVYTDSTTILDYINDSVTFVNNIKSYKDYPQLQINTGGPLYSTTSAVPGTLTTGFQGSDEFLPTPFWKHWQYPYSENNILLSDSRYWGSDDTNTIQSILSNSPWDYS